MSSNYVGLYCACENPIPIIENQIVTTTTTTSNGERRTTSTPMIKCRCGYLLPNASTIVGSSTNQMKGLKMTKQELQQLSDFLNLIIDRIKDDDELLLMYGHINNSVKSALRDIE